MLDAFLFRSVVAMDGLNIRAFPFVWLSPVGNDMEFTMDWSRLIEREEKQIPPSHEEGIR